MRFHIPNFHLSDTLVCIWKFMLKIIALPLSENGNVKKLFSQ